MTAARRSEPPAVHRGRFARAVDTRPRGRSTCRPTWAARALVPVLAAAGLALAAVSCSTPSRADEVLLDEIELPPGLERYEGADETMLDVTVGLAVQSQPGVLYPAPWYFVGSEDDTELDQWFTGAAARAGFEPPEDEAFFGSGPWHISTGEGDQYLSWGTIPVTNGDGTFRYVFALYLTQPD